MSETPLLSNTGDSYGSHHNQALSPMEFEPSERLTEKLDKLSKWRISRQALAPSQRDREFHGGSASVSLAHLIASPLDPNHSGQEVSGAENAFVAVKKFKVAEDTNIERLLRLAVREIGILVELSHPNVVKLTGFVEDISLDLVWLVFPWEANGNVRDFLTAAELEIPERISLIDDVAQGLEYLHCHDPPVCHGDLKSLNILVNAQYRAVITDFGSARYLERNPSDTRSAQTAVKPRMKKLSTGVLSSPRAEFSLYTKQLTVTGCLYTTRWAAPELLNDENSGLWSDIWAFGWICFEIMTNDFPFQGFHDMEVIIRVVQGDVPTITDDARMSSIVELCKLVTRCWSTSPLDRTTATECHQAIGWMPMIVPSCSPSGTTDPAAPRTRSPALLLELARINEQQGDYSAASSLYQEASRIYSGLNDDRGQADALCGLGSVERLQRQYGDAEKSYDKAYEIYKSLNYDAGRADVSWGLGEVYRLRESYGTAQTHYSKALEIYSTIEDEPGQAQSLCGLAEIKRNLGDDQAAIWSFNKALQIYTRLGSQTGRGEVLWGLAELQRLRGRKDKAISLYCEALEIYQGTGNQRFEADVLAKLAECHSEGEDFGDAARYYSQVISVYNELGNETGKEDVLAQLEAMASNFKYGNRLEILGRLPPIYLKAKDDSRYIKSLWQLADAYFTRNKLDTASSYYSRILELCTAQKNDSGRADALRSQAEVHMRSKEFEGAQLCYSEADSICIAINDGQGRVKSLLGLADLCRKQNKTTGAIAAYHEAMSICTDIGDDAGKLAALLGSLEVYISLWDVARRVDTLWKIGHLRRWSTEFDKATSCYSEALALATSLGDDGFKADALRGLGAMNRIKGHYGRAFSLYEEAMEIYVKRGDDRGRAKVLWGRGEAYCHTGNYRTGSNHYGEALQLWPALVDHQKKDELMWGISPSIKSVGDWPDDYDRL